MNLTRTPAVTFDWLPAVAPNKDTKPALPALDPNLSSTISSPARTSVLGVPAGGKPIKMEEVDLDDDEEDGDGSSFSRETASSDNSSNVFSDVSSPPSTHEQDEHDLDDDSDTESEKSDTLHPLSAPTRTSSYIPSSSTSTSSTSLPRPHTRSTSLDSASLTSSDTTLAKVIAERDALRKRVLELEAQIARMSAAAAEAANESAARYDRENAIRRRSTVMSFVQTSSPSPTSPRVLEGLARRLF